MHYIHHYFIGCTFSEVYLIYTFAGSGFNSRNFVYILIIPQTSGVAVSWGGGGGGVGPAQQILNF
jgi:hypothetical protein